ncbi:MAG: hypothetical protein U0930_09810 [Pirellulales bacterium]
MLVESCTVWQGTIELSDVMVVERYSHVMHIKPERHGRSGPD